MSSADRRSIAMPVAADVRRILQEAGVNDSLMYSVSSSSSSGAPCSPRGSSSEALPEQQEEKKARKEAKGENEEQGEMAEEDDEEADMEGCVPVINQEMGLTVVRTLDGNATRDDLLDAVHHQRSLIDRLMGLLKGINTERKYALEENHMLKMKSNVLARRLASLVPASGPMSNTATAATRPQQAAARDDVHGKPSDSVARAQELLRSIRHNRSNELPPYEQEAEVTSPPLASPFVASTAAVEVEDTSPAARAAAFVGKKQGTTPATSPVTPPESTPAVAVVNSAPHVAGRIEDGPERASSARSPATRASVGGRTRPSSRSSNHVRQTATATSRGVGSATRPVRRPSAHSQPTASFSGNGASCARPVSRPPRRQSKGKRNAMTCQQPLSCARDTALSRMRLRQAVKTSGPRGMVF